MISNRMTKILDFYKQTSYANASLQKASHVIYWNKQSAYQPSSRSILHWSAILVRAYPEFTKLSVFLAKLKSHTPLRHFQQWFASTTTNFSSVNLKTKTNSINSHRVIFTHVIKVIFNAIPLNYFFHQYHGNYKYQHKKRRLCKSLSVNYF